MIDEPRERERRRLNPEMVITRASADGKTIELYSLAGGFEVVIRIDKASVALQLARELNDFGRLKALELERQSAPQARFSYADD